MKLTDCTDGLVLVLTKDVTNPKPDRRKVRSFEALVTWPKGSRLMYRRYFDSTRAIEHDSLYGIVHGNDEGFEALIEACEPAPLSLENLLWTARSGGACTTAEDVLRSLIDMRKITLDDVSASIGYHYAQEMARPEEK